MKSLSLSILILSLVWVFPTVADPQSDERDLTAELITKSRTVHKKIEHKGDQLAEYEKEDFLSWFSLPAAPYYLIRRFWTIITYMFTHEGFLHIFFNMLWFYWFGKILTAHLGNKRMISTYLLGGICGGLFYIIVYTYDKLSYKY